MTRPQWPTLGVSDEAQGTGVFESPQLASFTECADHARVSRATVRKWAKAGYFEVVILDEGGAGGKPILRINAAEFDAFIKKRRLATRASSAWRSA